MSADSVHVTLDVGPAVHQGAGLSKYCERLAASLLQTQAARIDLSLFYNAHSGHALPASLTTAKSHSVAMGQYRWRLGALTSQLLRRQTIALSASTGASNAPAALYHATEHLLPYVNGPTVMTVHDLIFERFPQHHTRRNRLFLKMAMPTFVRAADAIIAVSQQTKRDLMELYQCPESKISVIYEGIDPSFAPASPDEVARVRQQLGVQRPYLFMMGTLEPRKNHAAALHALARLKAGGRPHQLVLAGAEGWLFDPIRDLVAKLGLVDDVCFAGYVDQADVAPLYSGADCLIMPSLYEGFGFPVLEAMACATPVVCSNTSSLPEVAGDVALTVPPADSVALADAVEQILADPALAGELGRRGRARAAKFRWSTCAAQTADLYIALAAASRSASGVHV